MFSSAQASIKILYLVIRFPLCSGHDAHGGVANCWVVKIMTHQMAGWVGNCDPVTHLSTFMRRIKIYTFMSGKKKSSWAEHLGSIFFFNIKLFFFMSAKNPRLSAA